MIILVAVLYRLGWVDRWRGKSGTHTHNVCGLATDVSDYDKVVKGHQRTPHPFDRKQGDFDFGDDAEKADASASSVDDANLQGWRSHDGDATSSSSSSFGVDLYGHHDGDDDGGGGVGDDEEDDHYYGGRGPSSAAGLAASRAAGWRVGSEPQARRVSATSVPVQQQALHQSKNPSQAAQIDVPTEYLCPLSLTLMTDPQIAADGNSYERSNMLAYFAKVRFFVRWIVCSCCLFVWHHGPTHPPTHPFPIRQ